MVSYFSFERAHTRSLKYLIHNISERSRIKKFEIFNLQYFTSQQTYFIQTQSVHITGQATFFFHSQWALERLVLTCAYLITGIQRVKRYILHPLTPMTAQPKTSGSTAFNRLGSTSILSTPVTSSPGMVGPRAYPVQPAHVLEVLFALAKVLNERGANFIGAMPSDEATQNPIIISEYHGTSSSHKDAEDAKAHRQSQHLQLEDDCLSLYPCH